MSPHDLPKDPDILAGEYVLGLLDETQRRGVEARLAVDPALRQAVGRWEERFHPYTALAPSLTPSERLWPRIQRSLTALDEEQRSAQAAGSVTSSPSPPEAREATAPPPTKRQAREAQEGRLARPPRRSGRMWQSLTLWRSLAGAGLAALVTVMVTEPPPQRIEVPVEVPVEVRVEAQPRYMVVLMGTEEATAGWVAQASSASQVRLFPLAGYELPEDRALELWTQLEAWNEPVSLGLIEPGRPLEIALEGIALEGNQLFAISLEPPGGSPTGQPTGPIEFAGHLVEL
ncbi:anti-sigma factor [Halomonas sp. Y3]|uniref:anti-sigma factor n=1 Tax=Halomonas sp. Y3 TaxID=2956797 RepID=UPI00209FCFA7|nr:anti-sigma factor [Halomonas sp. Y3]